MPRRIGARLRVAMFRTGTFACDPIRCRPGPTRKEVHAARQVQDAEADVPGMFERTAFAIADRCEEPTKARLPPGKKRAGSPRLARCERRQAFHFRRQKARQKAEASQIR